MSKTKKIALIASAFVLVAALAVVGVFAAQAITVTSTSKLSYSVGTNIQGSIVLTAATNGGTNILSSISEANKSVTFAATDTNKNATMNWGNLTFASKNATIVFTLTITNSGANQFIASFTEVASAGNVSFAYAYAGTGVAGTKAGLVQPITCASTKTAIITITCSITNKAKDVTNKSCNWALALQQG